MTLAVIHFFEEGYKPNIKKHTWGYPDRYPNFDYIPDTVNLDILFDIEPVSDWKKSLIEVGKDD